MFRLWNRFLGGRNITELSSRIKKIKYGSILDYVGEKGLFLEENLLLAQSFKNTSIALKLTSLGLPDQDLALSNARKIIQEATRNGNRVLVDAENLKNQKSINFISNQLIEEFNEPSRIRVFKTYQMYYMDSLKYLEKDIASFPNLGVKLTRGAYYNEDKGSGLLCCEKFLTDNNYNTGITRLADMPETSVILATHNWTSCMIGLRYPNFMYAQLLGMSDDLTEALYQAEVPVFKYVPYGEYSVSIRYMLRRLYENLDMIKNF